MAYNGWQATVQDDAGNAIPLAEITVREGGPSGDIATIYSDTTGTAKANPFFATVNGFAQFFAEPGTYYLVGALDGQTTDGWYVSIQPEFSAPIVLRGAWDASAGTFPGSGTAAVGDMWIVSTGGTVNSVTFAVGNRITALVDNASTTTYTANWFKETYSVDVTSVQGRTGAVVLVKADVGLGSVDNTADADKPVSTAQAAALDAKADGSLIDEATAGGLVPLVQVGAQVLLWLTQDGLLAGSGLAGTMRRSVLDGVVDENDVTGDALPVVAVGESVALWIDASGHLAGSGMAPTMRASAVSDLAPPVDVTGDNTPLITRGASVVLWQDADGVLRGSGLGAVAGDFAPLITSGAIPASTDGRTLHRARAAAAKARASTDTLRVAMLGDSWCQGGQIPTAMQVYLAALIGDCGKTWIHANTASQWSGVTVTASGGWTLIDASETASHPYGQGPDGQMLHTTGSAETLAIQTLACTEIRIFTALNDGTWRYRVDGGGWTTVVDSDASQTVLITTIAGLADATHLLEIDTTGNTGRVAFCGAYAPRAGAKAEVMKLGNGGLTGYDTRSYFSGTEDIWASLNPDLVAIILGTNDYIYADSTVAEYRLAITEMVATLRASCGSDVGIVLVAPALSPTTPVTPLSAYRDAAYALAISLNVEFLNCYDLIAPYATDATIWTDSRHPNQQGGDVIARLLNTRLLGV